MHLPEKEAAEVVASVEDTKETEFVFRADSFSPVLVVFGAAGGVEVDGTPYASLSQAFGALDGNGDETIRLLADVEIQRITFAGKSFTLDLNGKTIYATDETYKGIHISGEGARVVITSSAEGGAVSAKGDKAKRRYPGIQRCNSCFAGRQYYKWNGFLWRWCVCLSGGCFPDGRRCN